MGRSARSSPLLLPLLAVAALAAVAAWISSGGLGRTQGPEWVPVPGPGPTPGAPGGRPLDGARAGTPGAPPPGEGAASGVAPEGSTSGGVPPGLRVPSGEDLSDPVVLAARLREALGGETPRWELVGDLLGKHGDALPPDVRAALLRAFDGGRVPAAVSAFGRLRDPSLVADLLRLLDDPATSPEARRTVLAALVSMPGPREPVVAGLVRTLRGSPAEDRPALEAIARVGGPDAVRALVDAVVGARDAEGLGPETWRELSLRGSPEASQILAEALGRADLPPATLRGLVSLAGRPGASALVVKALLALDVPATDAESRRAIYEGLAATGDREAYVRLLAAAADPADPGAPAALEAIGETTTASIEARARLLASARDTSDDRIRASAVRALGKVRDAAAIPYMVELLAHSSPDVRRESVVALGGLGAVAEIAVEALGRAFVAGDPVLRGRIATALGNIGGGDARRLLDQLRIAEKDDAVRRVVEEAYGKVRARTEDK